MGHPSKIAFIAAVFIRTASATPVIHCAKPAWDFGVITDRTSVTNQYLIENTGDSTLEISYIQAGCTCTTTQLANKRIPAKKSTTLTAVFNPKNRDGKQRKTIRVYSNDQKMIELKLELSGTVRPSISTLPATVSFIGKRSDAPIKREIVLSSDCAVKIKNVTASDRAFTLTFDPARNGTAHIIELTIDPAQLKGRVKEQLVIETNHPTNPNQTVPIIGRLK